MYSISIYDEEEYGSRLARYLERKFANTTAYIRQFTDTEGADLSVDDAIVISEALYAHLSEKPQRPGVFLIREEALEGEFSRGDPPSILYQMISAELGTEASGRRNSGPEVVLLFSPMADDDLTEMAVELARHRQGDSLILGMEELGTGGMEKLCYYIHIREKQILQRIRELARPEEACFIIAGPDWFYPLVELSAEDIQWFFQLLKTDGSYRNVYLTAGPLAFGQVYPTGALDRVYLCRRNGNPRADRCMANMEKLLKADGVRYEILE